jgi:hypothetical protein
MQEPNISTQIKNFQDKMKDIRLLIKKSNDLLDRFDLIKNNLISKKHVKENYIFKYNDRY